MPHNGNWWPLWNPTWWSPGVSRHPLDPYSFVHLQTGVICFWSVGLPLQFILNAEDPDMKSWPLWIGFAITFALSAMFEMVENSKWCIDMFRANSGTSSDYQGDSYQNIFGDLVVVQAGYM